MRVVLRAAGLAFGLCMIVQASTGQVHSPHDDTLQERPISTLAEKFQRLVEEGADKGEFYHLLTSHTLKENVELLSTELASVNFRHYVPGKEITTSDPFLPVKFSQLTASEKAKLFPVAHAASVSCPGAFFGIMDYLWEVKDGGEWSDTLFDSSFGGQSARNWPIFGTYRKEKSALELPMATAVQSMLSYYLSVLVNRKNAEEITNFAKQLKPYVESPRPRNYLTCLSIFLFSVYHKPEVAFHVLKTLDDVCHDTVNQEKVRAFSPQGLEVFDQFMQSPGVSTQSWSNLFHSEYYETNLQFGLTSAAYFNNDQLFMLTLQKKLKQ